MERIAEVHLDNLRRVLEIAGDMIDIVYFYDDLASQEGLLLGPEMYRRSIQPFHQRIIDITRSHGKLTMMHSCGSVYPLINQLIEMGLNILNPVQPAARNMNPEKLAKEFGGRIAFHGGIDVQQFLPTATPEQVRDKVHSTCEVLGKEGGYILSGSHHLQGECAAGECPRHVRVSLGQSRTWCRKHAARIHGGLLGPFYESAAHALPLICPSRDA